MPSTEQVFVERAIPIPFAGADTATEASFEGRALSDGPLSKTFLKKHVVSTPHEESLGLAKPISEPTSGAIVLEESVTVPNAQLVMSEEKQPIQMQRLGTPRIRAQELTQQLG